MSTKASGCILLYQSSVPRFGQNRHKSNYTKLFPNIGHNLVVLGKKLYHALGGLLILLGDCERIVTLTACQRLHNGTMAVLSFRSLPAIIQVIEEFGGEFEQ